MDQETLSPILELQRQRALLQMEYEEERAAYQQMAEAVGVERRVQRGDAWMPVSVTRTYYNSLNQLCVEIVRQLGPDDDADHNFEFGRPVQFFRSEKGEVRSEKSATRSEKSEVRSEKSQHSQGGLSANKGNKTSHLSPLTSHFNLTV